MRLYRSITGKINPDEFIFFNPSPLLSYKPIRRQGPMGRMLCIRPAYRRQVFLAHKLCFKPDRLAYKKRLPFTGRRYLLTLLTFQLYTLIPYLAIMIGNTPLSCVLYTYRKYCPAANLLRSNGMIWPNTRFLNS